MAPFGTPQSPQCPHCNGILPIRPGDDPAPDACPFCQRELLADDLASPHARAESMRSTLAAQKAAQQEREYWREQQRKERAELEHRFHAELIEEGLLAAEKTSAVVMVPSIDAEMSPLPQERKQRFLDRLTKLANQVFSDSNDRGNYVLYEESADDDLPSKPLHDQVPIAGCTTCRGYCCMGGGEHAFFDYDSLAFRAEQHGIESVEEMVQTYRDLLPEQTNTDSCVFHTDRGCNIPRDLRAFTCNSFVCAGLDNFIKESPTIEVTEIAIVSQLNGERLREFVVREVPVVEERSEQES